MGFYHSLAHTVNNILMTITRCVAYYRYLIARVGILINEVNQMFCFSAKEMAIYVAHKNRDIFSIIIVVAVAAQCSTK